MHDQFDVTLEDSDLLGEVELTTNLIIAASEADGRLTDDEIDRILGVGPACPRLNPGDLVSRSRTAPARSSGRTRRTRPSTGSSSSTTERPCAVEAATAKRSPKSPPCPGAGPAASAARESAFSRAWASLSNDSTARTRPSGCADSAKPVSGLTGPAAASSSAAWSWSGAVRLGHRQLLAGVAPAQDHRRRGLARGVDHVVQAVHPLAVPHHRGRGHREVPGGVGGDHEPVVLQEGPVLQLRGQRPDARHHVDAAASRCRPPRRGGRSPATRAGRPGRRRTPSPAPP